MSGELFATDESPAVAELSAPPPAVGDGPPISDRGDALGAWAKAR